MIQDDLQWIFEVMGNDSPVEELVNLEDSWMKEQTEHFLALHLKQPGLTSVGPSWVGSLAETMRSRRLRGRRKASIGGEGKTSLSLSSDSRMCLWRLMICRI